MRGGAQVGEGVEGEMLEMRERERERDDRVAVGRASGSKVRLRWRCHDRAPTLSRCAHQNQPDLGCAAAWALAASSASRAAASSAALRSSSMRFVSAS